MLGVWTEKARALGHQPETVEAEILDFLREDERTWDLIVLSSALHHLEDYVGVIRAAAARLGPDGVLVTCFDPTRAGAVGRFARRADYIADVCLHQPGDAVAKAAERLRRMRGRPETGAPRLGSIAEIHASRGIDDEAVQLALRQSGMRILAHRRFPDARFAPTRRLLQALRIPSSFSIIARKPGPSDRPPSELDHLPA
jgi:SAM-dependent methyltransferase